MILRASSWPLLAILIWAAPAAAGVVAGSLRVPASAKAPAPTASAYPGRANALPDARPPAANLPEHAVVYVEALPASVAATLTPRSGPNKLVQENQAFAPRVLVIARGTSVDFPNRDAIYHNVFSLSPVKRFDLGKYPRGQSKSVRFDRDGMVRVYCEIHSNMEAFIIVRPDAAFSPVDANGAWSLPALPPGTYRLVAWHPDLGELKRDIEVTGDKPLRVELAY